MLGLFYDLAYWVCFLVGFLTSAHIVLWLRRLYKMSKKKLTMRDFGLKSWAVITGGSDGIGKAFAEKLALEGFNLFLIARNAEKLGQVAAELQEKYGGQVKTMPLDFAKFDQQRYLELESQLKALDVSILVNNVGINSPGFLTKVSAEELQRILTVNIWPQVRLTHALLPKLSERRYPSAVISISSITSLTPQPTAAAYAASKSFNDAFSNGLVNYHSKVRFVSMQPGYVDTPHIDRVKHKFLSIPASTLVERALRAACNNVRQTSGYWTHELEGLVFRLLPESFLARKVKAFRLKNYNV
jgi:short-subunit dehydrogenase